LDNSNNEAGFSIRRRAAIGNVWSVIATVGANVTTYQDTQVNSGTTYYYTVTATNIAGESTISNEAGATSFGGLTNVNLPPVNTQASAISTSEVVLRWTDNSVSEAGFRIRRKEGPDGPWVLIAIVDRNVTNYKDSGLSPGIKLHLQGLLLHRKRRI
jgi:titin